MKVAIQKTQIIIVEIKKSDLAKLLKLAEEYRKKIYPSEIKIWCEK